MDYAAYLRERALQLRNLALTTPDAAVCQELHHLADLCAAKAAMVAAARATPAPLRGKPVPRLRADG